MWPSSLGNFGRIARLYRVKRIQIRIALRGASTKGGHWKLRRSDAIRPRNSGDLVAPCSSATSHWDRRHPARAVAAIQVRR